MPTRLLRSILNVFVLTAMLLLFLGLPAARAADTPTPTATETETPTPTSTATSTATAAAPACASLGAGYTQDFNTLASSGTSTTLPAGWLLSEAGTNANITYTAGTGCGTYSFGAAGSAERALGGLQSGSLIPTFGACFVNDTGSALTAFSLA